MPTIRCEISFARFIADVGSDLISTLSVSMNWLIFSQSISITETPSTRRDTETGSNQALLEYLCAAWQCYAPADEARADRTAAT